MGTYQFKAIFYVRLTEGCAFLVRHGAVSQKSFTALLRSCPLPVWLFSPLGSHSSACCLHHLHLPGDHFVLKPYNIWTFLTSSFHVAVRLRHLHLFSWIDSWFKKRRKTLNNIALSGRTTVFFFLFFHFPTPKDRHTGSFQGLAIGSHVAVIFISEILCIYIFSTNLSKYRGMVVRPCDMIVSFCENCQNVFQSHFNTLCSHQW